MNKCGKRHKSGKSGESTIDKVVLVGTYKKGQLEWIGKSGIYNYPIKDDDKMPPEAFGKIVELWLYLGAKGVRTVKVASFRGIMSRDEFLAEFTDYPKGKGKPHSDRYAVFEVKDKAENRYSKLKAQALPEDMGVIVRFDDFKACTPAISKAIKAYQDGGEFGNLLDYLPADLSAIPRKQLCVYEAAIQLNFFLELDGFVPPMQDQVEDGTLRFVDLFAGIGGIRKGFEQACRARGFKSKCVFTSEIKPHAIKVLKQNNPGDYIHGDITTIDEKSIPDFDILLGGFPCQAFSMAGKRHGFEDTRGTLFFDVARILKEKKPYGFILENVEGLVNHDKRDNDFPYGNTLKVILETLEELGYKANWKVLNAKNFGVPQERKRIYIIGTKNGKPDMEGFKYTSSKVGDVLEKGLECSKSPFVEKLLSHYSVEDLCGKAIKDKRGGENNIHSWDFELKGSVSEKQHELLNKMLKERRKHKWAEMYGIDWMDGMPLTLEMISTFFDDENLEELLEDLTDKKYVVKEHPKRRIKRGKVFERVEDVTLPMGYNIVAGKMSFEVSKILSPEEQSPTLVAYP